MIYDLEVLSDREEGVSACERPLLPKVSDRSPAARPVRVTVSSLLKERRPYYMRSHVWKRVA